MKKLLSILLCFILLLTPFSGIPAKAETMPQLIVGDANCDGSIDAKDALDVLWITVMKSPPYVVPKDDPYALFYFNAGRVCAECNNNGIIDAEDALLILQYAVGKRKTFPRTDFQWNAYPLSWPGDR